MTTIIEGAPRMRHGRRRMVLFAALALVSGALIGAADTAAAAAVVANVGSVERAGDEAPGYPWQWPVEGRRVIIAPFQAPAHDYGPGHRGMDVLADPGSAVRAPASGVVAFRGTVVDRPLVTLDHGGGYVTTLEPVASDLSPGDTIVAGDSVGVLASGGHSPRGTLHVGVRLDDVYLNPRGLFGRPPRAILLPCCED